MTAPKEYHKDLIPKYCEFSILGYMEQKLNEYQLLDANVLLLTPTIFHV